MPGIDLVLSDVMMPGGVSGLQLARQVRQEHPDLPIVLATGYRAGVAALFPASAVPVDDSGLPTQLAGTGELDGVYFVGFDVRQPGGLLRTIAEQSVAVAERIVASPARQRTS